MGLLADAAHVTVTPPIDRSPPRPAPPRPGERRPEERRPDLLLPGTVAVIVLGSTAMLAPGRWTDPGWLLLGAICALPFGRLRHPVPVAAATLVLLGVYYPICSLDGPAVLAYVLALYTVAATGRLPAAIAIGGTGAAAAWYGEFVSTGHPLGYVGVFMLSGWLTAVIALGVLTHGRAAYADAVRRAGTQAARAREAESARRAGEERLHLAREVHDVVGHSLSVIAVQAAAALHRLERTPGAGPGGEQARVALEAVRDTSRQALRDVRAALHALRSPGLGRLPDLVAEPLPDGAVIRLRLDGPARPLPADDDLTAYRVVQEALTNVRRHATGARTVDVHVHYLPAAVRVTVQDDGCGPAADGATPAAGGHGLAGLAERVHRAGGTFTAGGAPGTGFRVRADLPLPPGDAS